MNTFAWIVLTLTVGVLCFGVGFIVHALRWPLSEEACAVEAAAWRKRAHEAEAKLRKIREAAS